MALLNADLSVWEIGLRWAGADPRLLWFPLPLRARDNFRTLIDAIRNLHLNCLSLSLEKRLPGSDTPPEFFIRHWLDDVESCIEGLRFPRKLLHWARIDRWDMYLWCERQGVPLPEFWFPPGWRLSYKWPEEPQLYDISGVPAEVADPGEPLWARTKFIAGLSEFEKMKPAEDQPAGQGESSRAGDQKLRINQRVRIACQVVAGNLWKQRPDTTIAAMVRDDAIQVLCGGSHYDEETVRGWIKVVAPDPVRERRGRPKKNNPPEG